MQQSLTALRQLLPAVDPAAYIESLGFTPFDWQIEALGQHDRLMLLCARQSGKSTVIGGKVAHKVRFRRKTEHLIVTPSKDQSKIVMQRFDEFCQSDDRLPSPDSADSVFEKSWRSTKNKVQALPGSERSVRGYADPATVIADEAAQIQDSTYIAFRPWLTGGKSELIAMTTPFGKRGWFYKAWENSSRWHKILVRVAWEPRNGRLVPAMPEDEYKDYWKERGVSAYYSPRHTREWLEEELEEMGEWSFRQEYCCEFMDTNDAWFGHEEILDAFTSDEEPIDNGSMEEDVEALRI